MADYDWTKPTPGGSSGTWGAELNAILDVIQAHPGIKVLADATALAAYVPLLGQVVLQADTATLYKCTNASGPVWAEVGPAAAADSVLTTKGDLLVYGAALSRLGVGSNGQVLTADAAQELGVKWATPSGGGGLPPERLYVPLGVDEGYDDEFNDGAINGAWVPVDVSGKSNTWYEVSGIKGISVLVPALQGDQKLTGLLRPLSGMSAPFYIETALRIFSRNQNYPMGGVIFADGVTVGAGNQIALRYSIIENKVEYGVHTGFDAQITNTNYSLNVGQKADWIYLRIAWTGANAFSLYASVDGVVWLKMNDVTPTITPTHFGLVMGSWANPPYPYTGNFGYFRVRSGTPDNG